MQFYHRHSFFPLVVIVLTSLLGWLVASTAGIQAPPGTDEQHTVDQTQYRDRARAIVAEFETSYAGAADDAGRTQAGAAALQAILDERVPAQYQQLHLSLAVLMDRVRSGEVADPLVDLTSIAAPYPWFKL